MAAIQAVTLNPVREQAMRRRKGPDQDSALTRYFVMRAARSEQRRQHLERELQRPYTAGEVRRLRRRWSRILFVLILGGGCVGGWLLGPSGWGAPAMAVGVIVALGYVYNRLGPPV